MVWHFRGGSLVKVFLVDRIGRLLADTWVVTKQHALQVALVMCFVVTAASSASADVITGNSAFAAGSIAAPTEPVAQPEDDSAVATSFMHAGSSLFDDVGSLLLTISPSQSVDLFEPREKLRGKPESLFPSGVLDGVGAGVPPASLGNCCASGGGSGGGLVVTPEPSSLLLLGSGIAIVARRLRRAQRDRNIA